MREGITFKACFQDQRAQLILLFLCLIVVPPYLPIVLFWLSLVLEYYLAGVLSNLFGAGTFSLIFLLVLNPLAVSSFFASFLILGFIIYRQTENKFLYTVVILLFIPECCLAFWNWSSMWQTYIGWK